MADTADLGRAASLVRVALLVSPLLGAIGVGGVYAERISTSLEAIPGLSRAVQELRHQVSDTRADLRALAAVAPGVDAARVDLVELRARLTAAEQRLDQLEGRRRR